MFIWVRNRDSRIMKVVLGMGCWGLLKAFVYFEFYCNYFYIRHILISHLNMKSSE